MKVKLTLCRFKKVLAFCIRYYKTWFSCATMKLQIDFPKQDTCTFDYIVTVFFFILSIATKVDMIYCVCLHS